MNFVLHVIFEYDLKDHITASGEHTSFKTLSELKNEIKNGKDYYKMPYELRVLRTVQVVDKMPTNMNNLFGIKTISPAQYKPVVIGQQEVNLIVADKLMYPNDVRTMLMEKYGSLLNFDNCIGTEVKPVFFGGVSKQEQYGLRDSKTGAPTTYTLRTVNCRYLNDQDIVMNTNFEQIWPIKSHNIPHALAELLARKTERVFEE